MDNKLEADFCIEIDFIKGSEEPQRVFSTLSELIETFQRLDESLAYSISSKLEPALLLEDVESGSIKLWLATVLKSIDDDAIKNLSWKKLIGAYLVKAKYRIIDFLNDKTTITDVVEIEKLEKGLYKLAEETDVLHIPHYQKIERRKLMLSIEEISSSIKKLNKNDKAYYSTKFDKKVPFNFDFYVSPEKIEELIVMEKIPNKETMILKVKKPDYLGESMWEFKGVEGVIEVKILDMAWLRKFQDRQFVLRPGDSIKAIVNVEVHYGYDSEVVIRKYSIEKVLKIIPMTNNKQLSIE